MNALSRLWQAVKGLADNITSLSETVAEVNAGIRSRLALDSPLTPEEVDHTHNGFLPPPPPAPEQPAEPDQARPRGRKKGADPSPAQ